MAKMKSRNETRAYHEKFAEDRFAAYELSDSEDFDNRQKARNILRYQVRGYCFELPPVCARYGKHCFFCPHVKCRENESYDGEKWGYDFDPDINRFAGLFDNLQNLAMRETADSRRQSAADTKRDPPKIDTGQSLSSLLVALSEQSKNTVI
jgi:hypothetical protein